MYIWCKNPEINPPLLPLIVPCNVDSTGYFDPTNSKKKKKLRVRGRRGWDRGPVVCSLGTGCISNHGILKIFPFLKIILLQPK